MNRVSLAPGPSYVWPATRQWLQDAYDHGVLSLGHRSVEFNDLSRKAITLLKEKLAVPANYTVLYASSATEFWQVVAYSLLDQAGSTNVYTGSFGEKWFEYTKKLVPATQGLHLDFNTLITPEIIGQPKPVLCLTQSETSNATYIPDAQLKAIRAAYPEAYIVYDATSTLGGLALDWTLGDVWFASVQKCLGLPAGMAVMVLSQRAIERVLALNHHQHYNSLATMLPFMENWQTSYTPNVLNIYLLGRMLATVPPIVETSQRLWNQAAELYQAAAQVPGLELLVQEQSNRSPTVLAFLDGGQHPIRQRFKEAGFDLGRGYGQWRDTTFRIANFPAIPPEAMARVVEILSTK